jgi:tripartite-type tricarboxylate transporter receptor subunit TctC
MLKHLLRVIVLSACASVATAQNYPSKPIQMVVPFAPGATSDAVARLVAERLKDVLGESVVVENRPGAGGAIGATVVAKAAPDGYTILLTPGAQVLSKYVMKSVPFEPGDFAPISNLVFAPYVIVAAKGQPYATLAEMVAYAKAHPEALAIGNSEITTRLTAESLSRAGNVRFTNINYKGGGPIVNDVLGGHLPLGVVTPVSIMAFNKEGRVVALAVTSPQRLAVLPDVPTVAEVLKVPGFDSQTWFALLAPAKTPQPVLQKLQQAVARVMAEPDFRKRLQEMGVEPATDTTSAGLAALMKAFEQRNGALVDATGIKPE